jgi:hypothetical protein
MKGLDEIGTTYTKVSPGGPEMSLYHTGCHVPLGGGHLSIQTHPLVAAEAFAETLLRAGPVFQREDYAALGYYSDDTRRFDTPEELFAHVREVLRYYAAKTGQGAGNEGGTSAEGAGREGGTPAAPAPPAETS